MTKAFRLKMARQMAEAFLRDNGYVALPIDPFKIAASRDIEVKSKSEAAPGVSGMLLRHGNSFGILYATHIRSEGFQRFSVGHELGHYFLEGHIDHILPQDGVHASYAGFVSSDSYELEADYFSSGLLMPAAPFKKALARRNPGLETIEFMAGLCRTSLTATGIRCAELSADAMAVVISTGQTIDYCFMSDAMKSLPQLAWLRKGSPVPKNTETARLNSDQTRVLAGDRAVNEIDVLDWLGGTRSAIVTEEVVGLGSYGKTLTVISSDTLVQPEQDEDEAEEHDLVEKMDTALPQMKLGARPDPLMIRGGAATYRVPSKVPILPISGGTSKYPYLYQIALSATHLRRYSGLVTAIHVFDLTHVYGAVIPAQHRLI